MPFNRRSVENPKKRGRQLAVEMLEARQVLAVTFHGGVVLPKVEAQGVYYGSDWKTNAAAVTQKTAIDNYVKYIVNSPYMDMLHNAGYGVSRGTSDPGAVLNKTLDKTKFVTDLQIQHDLQTMVTSGTLKTPDANRLYVVFVEPGVSIKDTSDGSTSINDFFGYHGAFAGKTKAGASIDFHYAVIAYPSGRNGSAAAQGYNSNRDYLTSVSSHEIAESVTDPNVGYSDIAWYDDANNGEIGDIVSGDVVLNGYCLQREANKSAKPMSPVGSKTYVSNFAVLAGTAATTPVASSHAPVAASSMSSGTQRVDAFFAALDLTPAKLANAVEALFASFATNRSEAASGDLCSWLDAQFATL